MWQGKDDMKVADRQDLVFSFFKPSFPWYVLAFWAVTIAAGVICNANRTAGVAAIDMSTEVRSATV